MIYLPVMQLMTVSFILLVVHLWDKFISYKSGRNHFIKGTDSGERIINTTNANGSSRKSGSHKPNPLLSP